jgi:hypothetical protein
MADTSPSSCLWTLSNYWGLQSYSIMLSYSPRVSYWIPRISTHSVSCHLKPRSSYRLSHWTLAVSLSLNPVYLSYYCSQDSASRDRRANPRPAWWSTVFIETFGCWTQYRYALLSLFYVWINPGLVASLSHLSKRGAYGCSQFLSSN